MSRPATEILLALALTATGVAGSTTAWAERADRDKPVNIEADRMTADDQRKTSVFDGRVVLTQGTMLIRADRVTVRQDGEGFQYGVAIGKPATFRQKREGFDDFVEGEAERIEYDGRSERIQLFERARMRRDSGDDVRGNYISYDSKTEFFSVQSAKDASGQGSDGRVRAVIMPKKKDQGPPPGSRPPIELKPSPAAASPRRD